MATPAQKPLFHWYLNPPIALAEAGEQHDLNRIVYEPLRPSPSKRSAMCMPHYHKIPTGSVQQSVPLQRLTLCPRRTCVPDAMNTVYVSLGQIKKSRKADFGL
jgi:hypothetical protein